MPSTKDKINLALIQLDVGPDKKSNLDKAEHYLRDAARGDADIITLPEMFNWMGQFSDSRRVAEDENGPSIKMLRQIAREFRKFIVCGSILEKQKRTLPLNTTFFIDRRGEIIAKYSKIHLFEITIPGEIRYIESEAMAQGKKLAVARTLFGRVGFAICNDLRYPEVFRALMHAGCHMIFVSSAFTKRTGKDHWHILNRMRALENQLYIISTNQSGSNAQGVNFFGHSLIADPWGKITTEGPAKGDIILYSSIDLSALKRIRKQMPTLKKIQRNYGVI